MAERHERGVLDTSVVVDFETLSGAELPMESAIAAVTLAGLPPGCTPRVMVASGELG